MNKKQMGKNNRRKCKEFIFGEFIAKSPQERRSDEYDCNGEPKKKLWGIC